MMKLITLLTASSLFLVAGCTQTPARPNPWENLSIPAAEATRPAELPAWPAGAVEGDRLYLTAAEANQLADFGEVSHTNYRIATELAEAVDELSEGYNDLVRAGNAEHELAELRGRMVEEERRARLWDKLSTWSILGLLGVLSVR